MKHNIAALWAVSAAALFVASPAQAQSLLSLDLGGGVTSTPGQAMQTSSTPAASSAAAATPAPAAASPASSYIASGLASYVSSLSLPANATNVITAASGTDAPATSTIASDPIVSPAYAAGTVTYIPPPLPTSKSSIDVSALPSSVPAYNMTASSNYTLPSATATGTFAAVPTNLQSNPYQMVFADNSGLPGINWNLADNTTDQDKTALCASQMQFCQTAGCNDTTATLTNFCDTKYMGVGCYCSKGESRLQQYQWPVMLADCQGRNQACKDACIKPGQGVADQNKCLGVCAQNYGSTCGYPGQYAANYAVRSKDDKPTYAIVQGGTAQNSAGVLSVGKVSVVVVAALVSAVVVVGL